MCYTKLLWFLNIIFQTFIWSSLKKSKRFEKLLYKTINNLLLKLFAQFSSQLKRARCNDLEKQNKFLGRILERITLFEEFKTFKKLANVLKHLRLPLCCANRNIWLASRNKVERESCRTCAPRKLSTPMQKCFACCLCEIFIGHYCKCWQS